MPLTWSRHRVSSSCPLRVRWRGPPRRDDLADRADRARVYEQILTEGTDDDVRRYVVLAELVDLCQNLCCRTTSTAGGRDGSRRGAASWWRAESPCRSRSAGSSRRSRKLPGSPSPAAPRWFPLGSSTPSAVEGHAEGAWSHRVAATDRRCALRTNGARCPPSPTRSPRSSAPIGSRRRQQSEAEHRRRPPAPPARAS